MKANHYIAVLSAAVVLFGSAASLAWAHVFPDHSEPRVGSTLKTPPSTVRIWFDGYLEPAFSRIEVYLDQAPGIRQNQHEDPTRMDQNNGHVNSSDPTLLEVSLSVLPPGRYRVAWNVVSVDGHRTEGDFSFTVGGPP
ncbi:MAG: copper resistance protein CopC [Nitrospirae bacterium]|nr:copper resistance protein CopC [Nitrospirota bacterium]